MGSVRETIDWVKPKIWPLVIGVVVMGGVWAKYAPESNRVASSPDRIIPAASSDMAEGALNPNLLEARVCDANTDQPGQEFLFVYDGKKQVGTVGKDGYIVVAPYESNTWQCR